MKHETRILLIIFIVLLLFTALSCSHRRAAIVSRRSDSVLVTTEVKYIEKLRDTTVYIALPVESREVIREDSSLLETTVALSRARIDSGGRLLHTLENKPYQLTTTVQVKDNVRTEAEKEIVIQRERVEVPVEKPLNGWRRFLQYSGVLLWGTALGYALFGISRLMR